MKDALRAQQDDAASDDPIRAASVLRDVARAKVNLTLQVRGRRPDGYHELESLVAFTAFGDGLELDPASGFSLETRGPFARAIEGGNLIEKAALLHTAAGRVPGEASPVVDRGEPAAAQSAGSSPAVSGAFRLDKQIPVAAGLGGGSADAAAVLRLLAGLPGDARGLSALLPLAARLGADVPVCLFSRPAIMTGIGEGLRFLPDFPSIPILLVNPRLPLATAQVFRELRAAPLGDAAAAPEAPQELASIEEVVAYAAARANDLEAPARRLMPVIGVVLEALAARPGARLARLSGSGPTCFALFKKTDEAEAAARHILAHHPNWWVKATSLV